MISDDNMIVVVVVMMGGHDSGDFGGMMGGADGHDGHMFRINFLIWVFNSGILSFIF
ncbi:MAG TPA: hypothetical protein PLB50_09105 [Candidatus Saccharicenans sp.]|nr:hypothetical protein [Candidatus Saccharicenans sp.]